MGSFLSLLVQKSAARVGRCVPFVPVGRFESVEGELAAGLVRIESAVERRCPSRHVVGHRRDIAPAFMANSKDLAIWIASKSTG